jgi:hypothetical protein
MMAQADTLSHRGYQLALGSWPPAVEQIKSSLWKKWKLYQRNDPGLLINR